MKKKPFLPNELKGAQLAVIGSGASLLQLTSDEVKLINNCVLLRTNWFFRDNVSGISKNIYGYFFGWIDDDMLKKFDQSNATTQYIFTPLKTVNAQYKNAVDIWSWLRQRDATCNRHLRHPRERGNLNLPTSGMQMMTFASMVHPSRILMAGIDFYKNRTSSGFCAYGRQEPLGNPLTGKKPHDLRTDISFLVYACRRIGPGNIQSLGSTPMTFALNFIKKHIHENPTEIINTLTHQIEEQFS